MADEFGTCLDDDAATLKYPSRMDALLEAVPASDVFRPACFHNRVNTISMAFDIHIIGAGRGGTSLLMGLIDAHPRCEILQEHFSTDYLMGRTWTDAETLSDDRARVDARIDNFLAACRHESDRFPGQLWGHKTTTEHVLGLADLHPDSTFGPSAAESVANHKFLDRYLERTKNIPTIFIVRDGRTCIRSKMNRTGQTLDVAIRRWRFSVEVLQGLKSVATHLAVVKLEDLVADPEFELNRLCNFLGIDYTDLMLGGTQNAKMRSEYRQTGFDQQATRITKQEPWFEEIRNELRQLDYL